MYHNAKFISETPLYSKAVTKAPLLLQFLKMDQNFLPGYSADCFLCEVVTQIGILNRLYGWVSGSSCCNALSVILRSSSFSLKTLL